MHIIICLDDQNGMLFNKRRQSTDRVLRGHILTSIEKQKLWMNAYSAKQFTPACERIHVCEDFLDLAGQGDYCFAEDADILPYLSKIETVIIYRWNRKYPADKFLDEAILLGRRIVQTEDFAGNSHDKITREVYAK